MPSTKAPSVPRSALEAPTVKHQRRPGRPRSAERKEQLCLSLPTPLIDLLRARADERAVPLGSLVEPLLWDPRTRKLRG